MRLVKKFFRIIPVIVLIITTMLADGEVNGRVYAANTGITVTDLSVSNTTPSINDQIIFSFKVEVPADKTITDIQWSTMQGFGGNCGCGQQIQGTNTYIASIPQTVDYYGTWQIDYIAVTCSDGTTACFYDTPFGSVPENGIFMDMSGGKAIVKNPPDDSIAPVIDASTATASASSATIKSTVTMAIKITDNQEIAYVWPRIALGNGGECSYGNMTYNSSNGLWESQVMADYAGKYEIISITAVDRSGNKTEMYNSAYKYYDPSNLNAADMSGANFTVTGTNANDTEGPKVDAGSIILANENIGLWETNQIGIKVQDDSAIVQVDVTVKQGKAYECSFGGGF